MMLRGESGRMVWFCVCVCVSLGFFFLSFSSLFSFSFSWERLDGGDHEVMNA